MYFRSCADRVRQPHRANLEPKLFYIHVYLSLPSNARLYQTTVWFENFRKMIMSAIKNEIL